MVRDVAVPPPGRRGGRSPSSGRGRAATAAGPPSVEERLGQLERYVYGTGAADPGVREQQATLRGEVVAQVQAFLAEVQLAFGLGFVLPGRPDRFPWPSVGFRGFSF